MFTKISEKALEMFDGVSEKCPNLKANAEKLMKCWKPCGPDGKCLDMAKDASKSGMKDRKKGKAL